MGLFTLNQFTTGGAININTNAVFGPGGQAITGTSNAAGATMGIAGNVTVKVAAHVGKGVNASKLAPGATTLVLVPLSAGKAGTFTGFFYVLTSIHYITVDFYAWTPGTLTFMGLTTKGAALPDVTAAGSFALTGMDGGTVTLSLRRRSASTAAGPAPHGELHDPEALLRARAVHAPAARRRRGGPRARREPQAQLVLDSSRAALGSA